MKFSLHRRCSPVKENREEAPGLRYKKARFLAVGTIFIIPGVKSFITNVKKSFVEASAAGIKTGFVTFFEALSKNMKNGLK